MTPAGPVTLTLDDLLREPKLQMTLVCGHEHLGRVVRWAHPTELVDPTLYLSGGELVLTVGSSLRHASDCEAFVEHLLTARAAAVGYGAGDVTEEAPDALVAACRRAGLPLLRVPHGMPFQQITRFLADQRVEVRTQASRRLNLVMAQLLEAVHADATLERLTALLDLALGGRFAFDGRELSWSPDDSDATAPTQHSLRQLERVLTVAQHGHDREAASRRQESGRLADLMLQGRADPEVLRSDLERAGIGRGEPVVVSGWPVALAALVQERLGQAAVLELRSVAVALSPDPAVAVDLARELALPVALGEPGPVSELRRAIPPVLSAFGLASTRGGLVMTGELATFEALLEQQPPARLQAFSTRLVDPLREQDRRHGSRLEATLRAYLAADGSLAVAADMLFTHRNTVGNRLRLITRLVGADPRVFDDRVGFAIGLWAADRRAAH
ncbi:MAG: PucR family transcriptional regulator [Nocardioides sp.]